MEFRLTTPVMLCIFKRLDTAKRVFEKIRKAKPEKLYIVADAARDDIPGEAEKVKEVREYIESHIDWPCEVKKNYAEVNMGCGRRMPSGISWVLKQEEEVIILEDDCVPDDSFFRYCQEMLDHYRDNNNIMLISGNNPIASAYEMKGDYGFTKIPFIWGWATWARAWEKYDFNLTDWPNEKNNPIWKEIFTKKAYWLYTAEFDELYKQAFDAWDYQMIYSIVLNDMLCVVPSESHVLNIGFEEESTHTKDAPEWMKQDVKPISFPIRHNDSIIRNKEFDETYMNLACNHGSVVHIKKMLGLNINKSIFER